MKCVVYAFYSRKKLHGSICLTIKGLVSLSTNLKGGTMEKNKERSLAYILSQSIDLESLGAVSGGGQGMGLSWCKHETMKGSGSSMRDVDFMIDVTVDM
jgi:hypothetical protein